LVPESVENRVSKKLGEGSDGHKREIEGTKKSFRKSKKIDRRGKHSDPENLRGGESKKISLKTKKKQNNERVGRGGNIGKKRSPKKGVGKGDGKCSRVQTKKKKTAAGG